MAFRTLSALWARLVAGADEEPPPGQTELPTVDLEAALARYRVDGPRLDAATVAAMSHRELRAEAKRRQVRGYSRMTKEQLRRTLTGG